MAVNNLQPANMAQSDKIFAITYQFDTPSTMCLNRNLLSPTLVLQVIQPINSSSFGQAV